MVPRSLGFKMPPEWAKRKGTFMEWPVREGLWPDGFEEARMAYANVANAISEFEEITMIVRPDLVNEARRMCSGDVKILPMEHDDSWMRDNGPTFIINENQELAGIKWQFNAWGEKYRPWDKDNKVASNLLDILGIPKFDAPIVLEGGSIHVDGEGTLLTTEECLLNKNRNPHLSREEIENVLRESLAIDKIIWLKRGLYGDETDGHVDNVACFAKPGYVVLQVCSDKDDPNYEISQDNIKTLEEFIDTKGRKIHIIKIEQPPVRMYKGERLTLSYINYYPVEGGIILPTFGGDASKADDRAAGILQEVFPDRKIVRIDGMPIIKGGGNVHCITQQMPYGTPAKM